MKNNQLSKVFDDTNLEDAIKKFCVNAEGQVVNGTTIIKPLDNFQPVVELGNYILLRNPVDIMLNILDSLDTSMITDIYKSISETEKTAMIESKTQEPDDPNIMVKDNRDYKNKIDSISNLTYFQKIFVASSQRSSGLHINNDLIDKIFNHSVDSQFINTNIVQVVSDPLGSSDTDSVNTKIDKYCHLANKQKNFEFIEKASDVKKLQSDVVLISSICTGIINFIYNNNKNDQLSIDKDKVLVDILGEDYNDPKFVTANKIISHLIDSSKIMAIIFYDAIDDDSVKEVISKKTCSTTSKNLNTNSFFKSFKLISDTMVNELFYNSNFDFSVRVVENISTNNSIITSLVINLLLPNDLETIFNRKFILDVINLNAVEDHINIKAETFVNLVGEFSIEVAS